MPSPIITSTSLSHAFVRFAGQNGLVSYQTELKVWETYLAKHQNPDGWTISSLHQYLSASSVAGPTLHTLIQFAQTIPIFQTNTALANYLLALKATNCSEATIRNYRSDINQFCSFRPHTPLRELITKPNTLAFLKYQAELGLRPASIKRKGAALIQFGSWLERHQYVPAVSGWLRPTIQNFDPEKAITKPVTNSSKDTVQPNLSTQVQTRPGLRRLHWPFARKSPEVKPKLTQVTTQLPASERLNRQVSSSITRQLMPWITMGMIAVFATGVAVFGSRQFISQAVKSLANTLPTSLKVPSNVLSFQGRLTDIAKNPISNATAVQFRLYDNVSGGTLLWDSGSCSITPDQDGIFTSNLGSDCGISIGTDVFANNSNVWLEVQVVSETLTPRQPIRSVAYALNSATLQGYPASASATRNTVLVMDNTGSVVLDENNSNLTANNGTFTVTAPTLSLKTKAGSNGNIYLTPDGTGKVGIGVSSLGSGTAKLAVFGGSVGLGTSSPGYLLDVNGGLGVGGTSNFTGNVGIGQTAAGYALGVTGSMRLTGAFFDGVGSSGSGNMILTSVGTGTSWVTGAALGIGVTNPNYWSKSVNNLSPLTGGDDLYLPATSLLGVAYDPATLVNTVAAFNGNVGIGTSSTNASLEISSTTPIKFSRAGYSEYLNITNGGNQYPINFNAYNGSSTFTAISIPTQGSWAGQVYFPSGNIGIGNSTPGTARLAVTGGNVGIGNTTPGYSLDVTGTLGVGGTAYFAGNVGIGKTNPMARLALTGTGVGTSFVFQTHDSNNVDRFTILDNGNVGIGKTNPSYALDIVGGLGVGGTSNFTGNVGIGQTAAGYNLAVNGTMKLSGALYDTGNAAGTLNSILTSVGTGVSWVTPASLGIGLSSAAGWTRGVNVVFLTTQTDNVGIGTSTPGTAKLAVIGNVGIGNTTPGYSLDVTGTLGVGGTAYFAGNVGIGKTNPMARLALTGTGVGTSFVFQTHDSAGNDKFTILDNGNVGIGITYPAALLHIVGGTARFDGPVDLGNTSGGTGYFTGNVFYGSNIGIIRSFGSTTTGGIQLLSRVGSAWDNTVTVTGSNVGIGHTAPTDKLDVAGGMKIGAGYAGIATSAPANGLLVQGNVGIGTSTPGYPLDVNGNTKIGGELAIGGSTFAGSAGWLSLNASGGIYWPSNNTVLRADTTNGLQVRNGPQSAFMPVWASNGIFSGNVGIGNSTPGTARLAVLGGSVGIGNTTPGYALDVTGGLGVGGTSNFTGNVGIGQTAAGYALGVTGNMRLTGAFFDGVGSSGSGNMILTSVGTGTSWVTGTALGIGVTNPNYWSKTNFNLSPLTAGDDLYLPTNSLLGVGYDPATIVNAVAGFNGNVGIGTSTAGTARLAVIGGNVGIGNTTPVYSLDVSGTLGVGGTAYFGSNVGVGTATPTQLLDVRGNIYTTGYVNSTVGPYYLSGQQVLSYSGNSVQVAANPTWTTLDLRTVNSVRVQIDSTGNVGIGGSAAVNPTLYATSAGNVGIGTTSPQSKLQITSANTGSGLLRLNNTGNSAGDVNGIDFYHENDPGHLQAYVRDEIMPGWPTKLHFGTANGSGGATTKMTIDNLGNVGIGTTNPHARLALVGTGVGTSVVFQTHDSNLVDRFTILDNGNVGIGITAPAQALHVVGNMRLTGAFFDGVGSSGSGNMILTSVGTGVSWVSGTSIGIGASGANIYGWTDGGSAVYLSTTADNVGIGTSSTGTAKLAIAGGNVGIGTSSPRELMEINGDLLTTGHAGIGNALAAANDNAVLYLYENFGAASGTKYGLASSNVQGTATSGTLQSIYSEAVGNIAVGSSIAGLTGTYTSSRHGNTGTVNNAIGLETMISNTTTGTISNAYGIKVDTPSNGGTITNSYGLYLADQNVGTNKWAIYQAGASDINYFGGNIGIGTSSTLGKLDIRTGTDQRMVVESGGTRFSPNGFGITSLNDANNAYQDITLTGLHIIMNAAPSTGNVGVGTTAPAGKLHIASDYTATTESGARTNQLVLTDTLHDKKLYVGIQTSGDYANISYLNEGDHWGPLILQGYSGNVGIGLTSPTQQLDLSGDLRIGGNDLYMASNTANSFLMADGTSFKPTTAANARLGLGLSAGGSGDVWVYRTGDTMTGALSFGANMLNELTPRFITYDDAYNTSYTTYGVDAVTRNKSTSSFMWKSVGVGSSRFDTGTQTMVLDTNGSLTISGNLTTASPASSGYNVNTGTIGATTVYAYTGLCSGNTMGNCSGTGGIVLGVGNTGATINLPNSGVAYLNGGNVGIGTTNPYSKLDVNGSLFVGVGSTFSNVSGWNTVLDSYGASHDRITSRTNTIGLDITTHNSGWNGAPIGGHILTSTNHPLSFGTNGTVKVTILAGGNVGIGTTNPTQALHVAGSMRLTGDLLDQNNQPGSDNNILVSLGSGVSWVPGSTLGIGGSTYWSKSGNNLLPTTAGDDVYLPTNSILGIGYDPTTLTANTVAAFNGNVGIGISGPAAKLHVAGNIFIPAGSIIDLAAQTTTHKLYNNTSNTYDTFEYNEGFNFDRYNGGTPTSTMFLSMVGNVGIGTTTPAYSMQVAGSLGVGGTSNFTGNVGIGQTAAGYALAVTGNMKLSGALYDSNVQPGTSGYLLSSIGTGVSWIPNTAGTNYWAKSGTNISPATGGDDLYLPATSLLGVAYDPATLVSTVAAFNGNVGIGTSAALDGLHVVVGNTATSTLNALRLERSDTDTAGANNLGTAIDFYLEDSTNVINQAALQEVKWADATGGSEDATISFKGMINGTLTEILKLEGTSIYANQYTDLSNNTYFMNLASGTTSLVTASNVGIGTTTPSGRLTVKGVGTGTGITFQTQNSSATPLVTMLDNGNVGIGTTNPLRKLQIAGDLNIEASSGIMIGNTALSGQYLRGDGTRFVSSAILVGDLPTITTAGGWTDSAGSVYLTTSADNVGIGTSSTGTAKLAVAGSVGIGNSAPRYALDITGGLGVGGTANFTGNVGIGQTANASYALGVGGNLNLLTGNAYYIAGTSVLDADTLGNTIVNSSLTKVGILGSGSIASGFGAIDTGADNIITTGTMGVAANTTVLGLTVSITGQFNSSYANTAAINLTGVGAGINFAGAGPGKIFTASNQDLALMPGGTGGVGIGTSSPNFKLEVIGTLGVGGTAMFGGRVGIGTSTPAYNLEVIGTGRISSTFITNTNTYLATTSGNNVGIGTSTAGALLDVNGAALINSLTLDANTGTALTISGTSFVTDILLQNGETIDNNTNGKILFTAPTTETSADLSVLGNATIGAGATNTTTVNGLLYKGLPLRFTVTSTNATNGSDATKTTDCTTEFGTAYRSASINEVIMNYKGNAVLNVGSSAGSIYNYFTVAGDAANNYYARAGQSAGGPMYMQTQASTTTVAQVACIRKDAPMFISSGTAAVAATLATKTAACTNDNANYRAASIFEVAAYSGQYGISSGPVSFNVARDSGGSWYFRWDSGNNASFLDANIPGSGNKVACIMKDPIGGSDYAETIASTDDSLKPGEILVTDPDSPEAVKRSTEPYQASILGVVPTTPGLVIGEAIQGTQTVLALSGRVPVKISSENGAIKIGDMITSSSVPGVGMKATKRGYVLGYAMNNYNDPDPNNVGTIKVFMNTMYYMGDSPDPAIAGIDGIPVQVNASKVVAEALEADKATIGDLTTNTIKTNQLAVSSPDNLIIGDQSLTDILNDLKKSLIADVETVWVKTKDLVVSGTAQINDLAVNNLTVDGQSLRDYISQVINTPQVSPTPTITPVANNLTPTPTSSTTPLGNLVTQDLTVSGTSRLASLLVENNATVAGSLDVAASISAQSARIAKLEAGMAEFDHVKANTAELMEATVSGTLYANNIANLDQQIKTAFTQPSLLGLLTGSNTASPASNLNPLYDSVIAAGITASTAQFSQTPADLGLPAGSVVLNADAAYLTTYFEVNGTAFVADSLGIGGKLHIGTQMEVGADYIALSDGAADTLKIQPSGKGKVELLAGVMTLDESGLVNINGSLAVRDNLKVGKTLLAGLLQPVDFGNPFQVQVAGISTESGELKQSRFEIINELGSPVATISATGRADFANGIGVGSENLGAPTSSQSAQLQSNKTAGTAILAAGTTELTITSQALTDRSIIQITPQGSTQNQVLYIKSQTPQSIDKTGQFIIAIDSAVNKDITFSWWIIQ